MPEWITTREAADMTGYNARHIGRLIRSGRIEARKWGTLWQVRRASMLAYAKQIAKMGAKRGRKRNA